LLDRRPISKTSRSSKCPAASIALHGGGRACATRLCSNPRSIVATDAPLTKPQAKRLATQAHDGMAHALRPARGALDGDIVFAASTEASPRLPEPRDLTEIGMIAADTLVRAIARGLRGVYAADALAVKGIRAGGTFLAQGVERGWPIRPKHVSSGNDAQGA
jgi:hypothetical protein